METTVILSDGDPCEVRKLGLYELDYVALPAIMGPWTYSLMIAGKPVEVEFDLYAYEAPPAKPDIPESEIKEKSEAWYDWREYHYYHAALLHEKRRNAATADYLIEIAHYILENCISEADRYRIVNSEDWNAVYTAALVQQLTREVLIDTLKTFKAEYGDKEIFEALEEASGGEGKYDPIRMWENQLMIKMGMTEAEYCMMSLEERARKVVAMKLPEWIGHLDHDRMMSERKKKNG